MPKENIDAVGSHEMHFLWLLDCSGSMKGPKIESLNFALGECIGPMRELARDHGDIDLFVRALTFADKAMWHVGEPTHIRDFRWHALHADGETRMGAALHEAAYALSLLDGRSTLPSVLVLVSDGMPTDDFASGLKALMAVRAVRAAVRIAIAIGDDADTDSLNRFIDDPQRKPLYARTAPDIIWRINEVIQSALAAL
jgi:uncharacterized protein YegL